MGAGGVFIRNLLSNEPLGDAVGGSREFLKEVIMARRALKPNKAVAKRFKVSKTGKLKRHHGFTSHLMSGRSANTRRKLRKAEVVPESHARRLRKLMDISKGPGKVATAKAKRARERAAKEAAAATTTASA